MPEVLGSLGVLVAVGFFGRGVLPQQEIGVGLRCFGAHPPPGHHELATTVQFRTAPNSTLPKTIQPLSLFCISAHSTDKYAGSVPRPSAENILRLVFSNKYYPGIPLSVISGLNQCFITYRHKYHPPRLF